MKAASFVVEAILVRFPTPRPIKSHRIYSIIKVFYRDPYLTAESRYYIL
jgi:hypothetical protein